MARKSKPKTQLFSAVLTLDDCEKFSEIASARQLTKSGLLRQWIANAYRAMDSKKQDEAA